MGFVPRAEPEPNKYVHKGLRNSRESVAVYANLSENNSPNVCVALKRIHANRILLLGRAVIALIFSKTGPVEKSPFNSMRLGVS